MTDNYTDHDERKLLASVSKPNTMDDSSGMDSALSLTALDYIDMHLTSFITSIPTSSPSTPSPNSIHFLPPNNDARNWTAWIIVGVVVGTIIIVFILVLVLRSLINMFRNRDYESIANNTPSSNGDNKSIFDNYNNGTVKINVNQYHIIDYDNNDTSNTDNTNLSSIIAGAYTESGQQPIQSTIEHTKTTKKRSKKRKPKPSKKRKSKTKSKRKDKGNKKNLRKYSKSQSKSTVNFISSGSEQDDDRNDRNMDIVNDDEEDEKIRQPQIQIQSRKDSKSNIVTVINSDTNEESQSTQRGDDDDRNVRGDRNIRARAQSSGSTQSQIGFSVTENENDRTQSGGTRPSSSND